MESQAIEARDRVGSGARPPDARAGLRHFGQKTQSRLGPRSANSCRAAALHLSREQRCHVCRFAGRRRLRSFCARSPRFLERGSSSPRRRSRVGGTEVTEVSPLLSLRLSVDYRNKPGVLRDVSLEIQPGEILGLVGQSGSGKSTLSLAILHRPSLLIADEATSALDTITQSEILRLFAQLNRELGMGILYISHDLLSVATLCHRIAILNAGEIVECGPPSQIFGAPRHAYTQKLVAALPRLPDFSSQPSPAEPVLIRA